MPFIATTSSTKVRRWADGFMPGPPEKTSRVSLSIEMKAKAGPSFGVKAVVQLRAP